MMKVITRMLAVVMSVVTMGMAFVACSAEKDIVGDWTVKTINGKAVDEVAAASGLSTSMVTMNLKLEKDKATLAGSAGSKEFQVSYKSNGVELMQNGANAGSIVYDKSAQTLTMKDNSTGAIIEYVFVKGTADLTAGEAPAAQEEGAADDQGAAEDQGSDDQGEDYGEDEGYDDEAA